MKLTAGTVGGLIGTATAKNNGLLPKEFSFRSIPYGKGFKIDFSESGSLLWDTCASIRIFVYSEGSVAEYKIVSGASIIEFFVGYIGRNCLNIKMKDRMLYCYPQKIDCLVRIQVTGYRTYVPNIVDLTQSEFDSVDGSTITPKSMI